MFFRLIEKFCTEEDSLFPEVGSLGKMQKGLLRLDLRGPLESFNLFNSLCNRRNFQF